MELSVAGQTYAFMLSLAFGALLGIFYDIFRIIRIAFQSGRIVLFIEDVLFWSISAVLTFIFMFAVNSGEVRVYILIGILAGAVIYYFTIGVLVYKSAKVLIKFIKRVLRVAFRIIAIPFRFIFRLLSPVFKLFAKILKKIALFLKKIIKNLLNLFKFKTKQFKMLMGIRKKRNLTKE